MKILVIRFSSLGDVVLTTVLFPNLRAFWPQAEVSVLTKKAYAPLFDGNPFINHVWVYDPQRQPFSALARELRMHKFDLVFDLQGNLRSFYVRLLTGARRVIKVEKNTLERRALVWFKINSKKLEKSVREKILDTLASLEIPLVNGETQLYPKGSSDILKIYSIQPDARLIGIAPGARHRTKQWSPAKFAQVANSLCDGKSHLALLLGDRSDAGLAGKIMGQLEAPCRDLTGWTSLSELVALMSRLTLLITNDSGLLHIAEALNIPTVALFGPTVRQFGFAPYRSSSRMVEVGGLECRPCSLHGTEECPLKHHRCMDDINVADVLTACKEVGGRS